MLVSPRLALVRGALVFEGTHTVRIIETISTLPGKKRQIDGVYYIQESEENVDHILGRHPGIEMDSYLRNKYSIDFEEAPASLPQQYADIINNYVYKTPPYKHQQKDVHRFCDESHYALFYEMGGGKTKVIIDVTAIRYLAGDINTLVILAPKGVHRQWIEEQIVKHLPDSIPRMCYTHDSGMRKSGKDDFEDVLKFSGLAIFAINDEAVSGPSGQKVLRRILASRKKTKLVYDESSRIKEKSAKRSKFLHQVAPLAKVRAILNGTPISKGAVDLFSQFLFLHPTILGSNFYAFRNKYCIMGGYEGRKVIGYRDLESLQVIIDRHSSRVLKRDCLDLPPKMYIDHYVELTPEQQQLYDSIRKEFIALLDSGEEVQLPTALGRVLALQGVLNGWIKKDGLYTRIPTLRTEVMSEILRQDDRKAIVWIKYHEDLRIVTEYLRQNHNFDFAIYTGLQNDAEKRESIRKFRQDAECQVIVASKAMDRGWDLIEGKQSIWYTPPNSVDSCEQSDDRIHRIGQEDPVNVRRLTTGWAIDHKNWLTLASRKDFATSLMDVRSYL